VVDITAPTVTLTSPASGAATNSQKPTFSGAAGTATGDAATAALTIYSGTDTSGTLVQSLNASVSSGTYSVALTTALADGTYTAQTYQSDAAGNIGQSSANTFTVDTTAPTVSITAPADASSMTGGSPTLTANASHAGGSGVASVQFQLRSSTDDGSTWGPWANVGLADTTAPCSATPATALAPATYQVQAIATDKAGNSAASASVRFIVQQSTTISVSSRSFQYSDQVKPCCDSESGLV